MVAHQNKQQNRPIGLVKPVSADTKHVDQEQYFKVKVGLTCFHAEVLVNYQPA